MAWAQQIQKQTASGSAVNSITASWSPATKKNNLLVACYAVGKTFANVNAPSGWTEVNHQDYNTIATPARTVAMWYKVAAGSDSNVTVSLTSSQTANQGLIIFEYNNCFVTSPNDVAQPAATDSASNLVAGTIFGLDGYADALAISVFGWLGAQTFSSFSNNIATDEGTAGTFNIRAASGSVASALTAVNTQVNLSSATAIGGVLGTFKIQPSQLASVGAD